MQSPKNAVAPSDIVFNRPPVANPISTGEFFTGVQSLHVKTNTSLHSECHNNSYSNYEIKSEKKFGEVALIDAKVKETGTSTINERTYKDRKLTDETSSLIGSSTSNLPPPLTSCLVDSMVRSCSVGESFLLFFKIFIKTSFVAIFKYLL